MEIQIWIMFGMAEQVIHILEVGLMPFVFDVSTQKLKFNKNRFPPAGNNYIKYDQTNDTIEIYVNGTLVKKWR